MGHLSRKVKESYQKKYVSLNFSGTFFMDIITKSALEFNKLLSTKYHFVVSKKRVTRYIILGFASTDFYHIAGLQYLSDVDIKRNRGDTISLVINGRITDSLLQKSRFYYGKDGEERSVFHRIEELRNLRQYIESDNYKAFLN